MAAVQPRGVAQRANPDSPLSAHETLAVRASKHCACCRRTTSLPWVLSWRLPSRRTRALQVGRPRPEGTAARHPGRKRRRQRHWAVASRLRSLLFNRCALSARAPARHWTRRDQQGAGGPSSSPHPPMHLPLLRMLSSYISTPGGAAPPDPPPLRWAGLIRYLPDPLSAHCRGGRCALAPPERGNLSTASSMHGHGVLYRVHAGAPVWLHTHVSHDHTRNPQTLHGETHVCICTHTFRACMHAHTCRHIHPTCVLCD